MNMHANRRRFLGASAAGSALFSLGDLGFLSQLGPVSAAEAVVDPKIVRLDPEIEPLVRLLEETSRDSLLEEVAARIKKGLSYRDVVAALLLAGVRNVQPRPSVGHKFHAVLVVNSAHLASLASPDSDRWLPIFWASIISRTHKLATSRKATGPWPRSTNRPCRLPARPEPRSRPPWTTGTKAPPMRRSPLWLAPRRQRNLRDPFPLRRARLSLDRPQGDLCCEQSSHAPVHRLAARRARLALAGLRASQSQRRKQPSRPRLCRRPLVAPQPGPLEEDQGRLGRRRAIGGRRGRLGRHASPRLRRRNLRSRSRPPEQGRWPAIDLGCSIRSRRRAHAAPARARVITRGHHHQCPSLRLPGQRRRPNPAPALAPERRFRALVPRRHGRSRQAARGPNRPARTARRDQQLGPAPWRRSSPTPRATA